MIQVIIVSFKFTIVHFDYNLLLLLWGLFDKVNESCSTFVHMLYNLNLELISLVL